MSQPTINIKNEIISLTSLRGVASLGVVIYHLYPPVREFWNFDLISPVFNKGYLWVDFFFALSGFIMCYVYRQIFANGVSTQNYIRFMWVRLIRIYPVHFATLMVFVGFEVVQYISVAFGHLQGIAVFSGQSSPFSLAANVLLIHAWGVIDIEGWNQPSWSISAEFFAYLVFPFLAVWLNKNRSAMMVFCILAAIVLLSFLQVSDGNLNTKTDLGFIRGLGGFCTGMVVFCLAGHESRLSEAAINYLQTIAVAGILAVMHFSVADIVIVPFFAILILASSADRGWIGWVCRLRPVYFLGLISYSLYMTNNIVTQVLNKRWVTFFPELSFVFESAWVWLLAGVELALVIALAYASYIFIENPSRIFLRRKFVPALKFA